MSELQSNFEIKLKMLMEKLNIFQDYSLKHTPSQHELLKFHAENYIRGIRSVDAYAPFGTAHRQNFLALSL